MGGGGTCSCIPPGTDDDGDPAHCCSGNSKGNGVCR
jgi:hypothetical protein